VVTGEYVARAGSPDLRIRIDGCLPLPAELVKALAAVCERAEDGASGDAVILEVSGVPEADWAAGLSVAQVSRWERGLRRLERLPAVTIAIAEGDCGGYALDALLANDYRIMFASGRLMLPVLAGATWPGMALYRLVRQAASAALARRAVLFGVPIGADEALAMGIVDDVAVDAASALATAAKLATAAEGTELAVRRQLMLEAPTASFEDALGVHLAACDRALRRAAAGSRGGFAPEAG
jgi:isomerase DpgB